LGDWKGIQPGKSTAATTRGSPSGFRKTRVLLKKPNPLGFWVSGIIGFFGLFI